MVDRLSDTGKSLLCCKMNIQSRQEHIWSVGQLKLNLSQPTIKHPLPTATTLSFTSSTTIMYTLAQSPFTSSMLSLYQLHTHFTSIKPPFTNFILTCSNSTITFYQLHDHSLPTPRPLFTNSTTTLYQLHDHSLPTPQPLFTNSTAIHYLFHNKPHSHPLPTPQPLFNSTISQYQLYKY